MIQTTETYQKLFEQGAIQEYKVEINGVVYTNSSIFSISAKRRLFDLDTFTIGSWCASSLNVKFALTTDVIPRNADIKFYYRYVGDTSDSSSVQQQVVDENGNLRIFLKPNGVPMNVVVMGEEIGTTTKYVSDLEPYVEVVGLPPSEEYNLIFSEIGKDLYITVQRRGNVIESGWVFWFQGKVTKRINTNSVTEIEAVDAAANTEYFLDVFPTQIPSYPANNRAVAVMVANYLGLQILNIEDILNISSVEYPTDMTIIEVMKNIASASGGNWTITQGNKLKLVIPNNRLATTVLYPAKKKEHTSALPKITRFTMYHSDSEYYTYGNDTGSELVVDNPWATQQITSYVFGIVSNFNYRGQKGTTVFLDPAVELGDNFLYVGMKETQEDFMGLPNRYFGQGNFLGGSGQSASLQQHCATMNWTFSGSCSCEVEAPQRNETVYDDPYTQAVTREFNRKVTLGNAYQGISISRQDGLKMLLSTDGTEATATGRFYASLLSGMAFQYRDSINDSWRDWLYFDKNEKVFKLALYDTATETGSKIEATFDRIGLSVSGDGTSSEIALTKDGIKIENTGGTIEFTGLVKFTDLQTVGQTEINGGNIISGTIQGQDIYGGKFWAEQVNGVSTKYFTMSETSFASFYDKGVDEYNPYLSLRPLPKVAGIPQKGFSMYSGDMQMLQASLARNATFAYGNWVFADSAFYRNSKLVANKLYDSGDYGSNNPINLESAIPWISSTSVQAENGTPATEMLLRGQKVFRAVRGKRIDIGDYDVTLQVTSPSVTGFTRVREIKRNGARISSFYIGSDRYDIIYDE